MKQTPVSKIKLLVEGLEQYLILIMHKEFGLVSPFHLSM